MTKFVVARDSLSLSTRLRSGIAWNVVATGFTQGSTFLASIIVARLLGRDLFGEFAMVQTTLLAVTGIAQLATGITATKYVAEYRSTDKDRTGRILGLCSSVTAISGTVAALLLLAGSTVLARVSLNAPQLGPALMISAGAIPFAVMSGYQSGALVGLEGFRLLAGAATVHGLVNICLLSVFSWFWGINGAFAGIVITAALRWILFGRALRTGARAHGIEPQPHRSWSEAGVILNFALPSALAGLTSLPALWLGNVLLANKQDGYSELALYNAATSLRMLALVLPQLLNTVGSSLLNNQRGLGKSDRFRRVFWANLAATAAIALTGALALAVLGGWLLGLFGPTFREGHGVLIVLLISLVPESLAIACHQAIQSQARMWLSLVAVSLPRDLAMVLGAYVFIPSHGAIGLAWAYTLAWTMAFLAIAGIVVYTGLDIAVRSGATRRAVTASASSIERTERK
jgi:O-antigen/teichoic acid export membrane protein